jgi:hypothetical protein
MLLGENHGWEFAKLLADLCYSSSDSTWAAV